MQDTEPRDWMDTRPRKAREVQPTSYACVLDTNVLLDFYSFHGLVAEDEADRADPLRDEPSELTLYRARRLRETVELAMLLHSLRATTFGLTQEGLAIAQKAVPPEAASIERDWLQHMLRFVGDYVVFGWTAVGPTDDPGHRGTAADVYLVGKASELAVPMVTYEGMSHTGRLNKSKEVWQECARLGVPCYTPPQFVEKHSKYSTRALRSIFLTRLDTAARAYALRNGEQDRSEVQALHNFRMYLRGLLAVDD